MVRQDELDVLVREQQELPVHSPLREKRAERPVEQLGLDGDDLRALAAAVIRCAVADLHVPSYRKEAQKFLLQDLWEEDCLWRAILGDLLPRPLIEREVRDRLKNGRKPRYQRKLREAE